MMQHRKIAALAALMAMAPHAWAGEAGGEAFQGLMWGDSEQEVRTKFPAARPKPCTADELKADLFPGKACGQPYLHRYEIEDQVMDVEFRMLAGDRLAAVWMSQSDTAPPAPDANQWAWKRKYERLKVLLSDRYGVPTELDSVEKSTFTTTSTRWTHGSTLVSLSVSTMPIEMLGTMYNIQVKYEPAKSLDAGKL